MIAVNKQKVDRGRPRDHRLVAPPPQENEPTTRIPGDLAKGDPPLEAHAEPTGWMRIDARDRAGWIHHAPQERGVDTMHDTNLDQTPFPRGILHEASPLLRRRWSAGRPRAEPGPEPARRAAVQHGA